ncbi:MAG TPA: pyridoxal phosphate-dependent aminotransferase [Candidatus Korarchaeota archaeon]|nr:MAG: hypothetical protein DRO05_01740 [Candidatus Korarchaeota archaeon]HDD68958.1 pyridoxal phosphate-dependent aminotransferase [Candidatus Korarchaeota archaeon]
MGTSLSQVAKYALENPSSIREIMSVVADFRKHPEKYPRRLIYLGGGWPQDPPPEPLRKAFLQIAENKEEFRLAARYPPTRGDPDFLEALVIYEREIFGREVEEAELLSGIGSTDLAVALFFSILDPGDEVILTNPCYLNYTRQIEIVSRLGVSIKRWPTIKDGEFSPDLDELQGLITDKTKLILLVTPGNPDGQVFDEKIFEGVVETALDKNVFVAIDIAYRAFHYETGIPSYLSRPRRENEIWIATLSKELRVPGWRMGYLIAEPELIRAIETIQQAMTLCPAHPQQLAFVKMLSQEDIIRELRSFLLEETPKKYHKIASLVCDELDKVPHIRYLRPAGGFYVFFDVKEILEDSKTFVSQLLNDWQVALAPGVDFGMEGWVRLSFAPVVEDQELLVEGMERIRKFISSRLS